MGTIARLAIAVPWNNSIPHIPLIELNLIFFEEQSILLLKGSSAMVLFLDVNVMP